MVAMFEKLGPQIDCKSDSEFAPVDFSREHIHYTEVFLNRVSDELSLLLESFKSLPFIKHWVAHRLRDHMHDLIWTAQRVVGERIEGQLGNLLRLDRPLKLFSQRMQEEFEARIVSKGFSYRGMPFEALLESVEKKLVNLKFKLARKKYNIAAEEAVHLGNYIAMIYDNINEKIAAINEKIAANVGEQCEDDACDQAKCCGQEESAW